MKLYLKMMAMLMRTSRMLVYCGLVLDKNVPVCSIQSLPEKWGCIDHLTYMYFFFQHKVVMGKTMEDWCRFSVCFWHTFRGTGMW